MKNRRMRDGHYVRIVQFLLNGRPINRFLAALSLLIVAGCSTPPQKTNEPVIPLFHGYPLPVDSLQPAGPLLVKGDGEGLYRLAAQNDAALKKRLDQEAAPLRRSFCDACNEQCRRRRVDTMKALTEKRNLAQRKQLKLRLDALEGRLETYSRRQGPDSVMSEFRRNRLLLETVADERLLHIQEYWLQSLLACESAVRPEDRLFLPYYTAYFKLVKSLPAGFAAEFFP